MSIIVYGSDISMNHGAVVQLRDGEFDGVFYYTDNVSSAKKSENGTLNKPESKQKDKHILQMARLAFFYEWFAAIIAKSPFPESTYVGIEDYALDAGRNAQHTGEIGGAARKISWSAGANIRLHDPMSVKLFGAHHGHADKLAMEKSVAMKYGMSFGKYNGDPSKQGKKSRQTSEDICDAFVIAKMVWTEILLKNGSKVLRDLHEQEIRVFNRTTKFMPMNLLDRDWISQETTKPKPKPNKKVSKAPRVKAKKTKVKKVKA